MPGDDYEIARRFRRLRCRRLLPPLHRRTPRPRSSGADAVVRGPRRWKCRRSPPRETGCGLFMRLRRWFSRTQPKQGLKQGPQQRSVRPRQKSRQSAERAGLEPALRGLSLHRRRPGLGQPLILGDGLSRQNDRLISRRRSVFGAFGAPGSFRSSWPFRSSALVPGISDRSGRVPSRRSVPLHPLSAGSLPRCFGCRLSEPRFWHSLSPASPAAPPAAKAATIFVGLTRRNRLPTVRSCFQMFLGLRFCGWSCGKGFAGMPFGWRLGLIALRRGAVGRNLVEVLGILQAP